LRSPFFFLYFSQACFCDSPPPLGFFFSEEGVCGCVVFIGGGGGGEHGVEIVIYALHLRVVFCWVRTGPVHCLSRPCDQGLLVASRCHFSDKRCVIICVLRRWESEYSLSPAISLQVWHLCTRLLRTNRTTHVESGPGYLGSMSV